MDQYCLVKQIILKQFKAIWTCGEINNHFCYVSGKFSEDHKKISLPWSMTFKKDAMRRFIQSLIFRNKRNNRQNKSLQQMMLSSIFFFKREVHCTHTQSKHIYIHRHVLYICLCMHLHIYEISRIIRYKIVKFSKWIRILSSP